MYRIATETPDDVWEVEALYDTAFGPGRAALSSYRLRDGVPPVSELCLVARDDLDIIGGCIRFWPILVGEARCLLLGPIAVHPTRQGEGLGGELIAHSLGLAKSLGWTRVLLVGDAPYYMRFGFVPIKRIKMPPPTNPDRILGQALVKGAFDGVEGAARPWPKGMQFE